jgi:di/tricarboxylate transporter
MGSSWFIKGIGYLLIAVFLGVVLWLIRLKPKEVRRKKVGRKKVITKKVRKKVGKRKKRK